MSPYFVLAELYAKPSVSRVATSALPNAPVIPHVPRWHRVRHVVRAIERWFGGVRRPSTPVEGVAPADA